jgi:hypothetical protein
MSLLKLCLFTLAATLAGSTTVGMLTEYLTSMINVEGRS